MKDNRCLYCYHLIENEQPDFHPTCSKKIFGTTTPPALPYTEAEMNELALKIIQSQITITGVQPKLSLVIGSGESKNDPKRFTIVGLWGGYILKPPTSHYHQLPEVEDLTMHLASIAKINVVPHSLIRLQSGNLAYITKRIDRIKKGKLHMEDMCQLTQRLTEEKYNGSYEQIAKVIFKYSDNPGLDVINFFEQVVFSFLTGNADMHLKNFSLINQPGIGYSLAPAYDMVATKLVNPADQEEMALTVNGKKRKINRSDFISAFATSKLDSRQQQNILTKFNKYLRQWLDFIDICFLDFEMKQAYKILISERHKQLSE